LRELRRSDRAQLEAVLISTQVFYADEIAVALELIDKGEDDTPDTYRFVVAELDGRVVGYSCYGHTPCTDTVFDMYWAAVDKTLQNQGLGKKIFLETERRIRALGGRMIVLETASKEEYQATRAFYLRNGYHEAARVKDFYKLGDDKVIYVRVLPSNG